MFRHSEIHRLLQQRKWNADLTDACLVAKAAEEPKQIKQTKRDLKT